MIAEALPISVEAIGLGNRLRAEALRVVATPQTVTATRTLDVDLGDLELLLDRLNYKVAIVDGNGLPTFQFQRFWQDHCEKIERAFAALRDSVLAIQAAYNAAAQANAAAAEANNVVAEVQETVAGATEVLTRIENGEINFPSIVVGGQEFGYDGITGLVPLP